eukprot:Em0004g1599a
MRRRGSAQTSEVKYVVDRTEQEDIVLSCHRDSTSGHVGLKRTVARITECFIWPGVVKDVENVIKRCDICQTSNKK